MKGKTVKLISSIVLGGFILSAAGLSFAASPAFSAGDRQFGSPLAYQKQAVNPESSLASRLSKLVSEGTLTQDQLDAVLKAFPKKQELGQKQDRVKPEDTLSQLVSSQTLTQDQADAILKVLTKRADGQKQNRPKPEEIFSQLVTKGTITQEQADAILKALPQRPEPGQKPQGTRLEEIFSQLVTNGTITQEQADVIMKQFPHPPAAGTRN